MVLIGAQPPHGADVPALSDGGQQDALDELIRQQNMQALGGEDIGTVLSSYLQRRGGPSQQHAPVARGRPRGVASDAADAVGAQAIHVVTNPVSFPERARAPRDHFAPGQLYDNTPEPPASEQTARARAPPDHLAPGQLYDATLPAQGSSPHKGPGSVAPSHQVHTSVRVRKDAPAMASTQMDSVLHPVRNGREQLRRAGLSPHNHHRDNVQRMREKQQAVAARKADKESEAERQSEARRRARDQALKTAAARSQAPSGQPGVAEGGGAMAGRRASHADAQAGARGGSGKPAGLGRHGSYGKVPKYLMDRKAAQESEEQLRREEAERSAGCPPGTRLVTEEERANVLATIANREKELKKQLQALPFVTKTLSVANKKKELEGRLDEIEEARAQYSKPRVYVALED